MGYLDYDGLLHFWQSIKTKFAAASHTHAIADTTGLQEALDSKVSKSGDTMTGKLDVPAVNDVDTSAKREIATGVNKDSYFQCRKFRGEGTASNYYHAVDFGFGGHNQVDFHEFGGVWNFLKNQGGKSSTGVQVGSIQSGKGWVGKVNGFDIGMSVPSGSKLTDTVYDDSALKERVTALEGREDKDTTYGPATTDAAGLMSAADKSKLDGIEEGATKTSNIVAANAAAHNAIYRGKDITSMETSGELYVNIANGTFDDIYIGDYFTKSINGTNYALRIAAFNYYYNMGNTAFTKPHAVIIPDSIFGTAQMNSSNVVTGGYVGTKMRTDTLVTWAGYLSTAFGSHLKTCRAFLDNACNGTSYTNGAWYDSKVELMTEEQVYGARQQGITNRSGWCYPGVDYAQFPLFALDHSRICNRSTWWLRSVYSPTSFARVSDFGVANRDGASASFGVRPRFLIG